MGKLRDSYRSMRQGTKKCAAVFLACVESAAHSVFRTFQFDNVEHKADVKKIIEAFEKHCIGEANVTYEATFFTNVFNNPACVSTIS